MVTDTTKKPYREWLFGQNPHMIESQEEDGQRELAESKDLPCRTNDYQSTAPIYIKMGIEVLEDNSNHKDPLFVRVILPNGWKVVPTEHSMWSNLVDNLNRKRAMIFYKAAFYDRSAHISFRTRYRYEVITYLEEENQKYPDFYEKKNHTPIFGRVYDGDKIIFETTHDFFTEKFDNNNPKIWWDNYDALEKSKHEECKNWLNERYPEWNNIHTYW